MKKRTPIRKFPCSLTAGPNANSLGLFSDKIETNASRGFVDPTTYMKRPSVSATEQLRLEEEKRRDAIYEAARARLEYRSP
ncbi:MAG: hypothetical protein ABH817_00475 [archaeon]